MFAALIARAAAARVGTGRVVHRTDKAVVATGRRDGRPVIVKLLTADDPYWVGWRQHELRMYELRMYELRMYELRMYELFTDQPPPVRVPRVLYADARLTVLTQLPGQRLDDQRHLTRDVSPPPHSWSWTPSHIAMIRSVSPKRPQQLYRHLS
ncbi:hypothetical protein DLJ59_31680 [Micromonospora inaquosa]|uniref:Aminoglycoside phosphotransferase domain-containing protein n=1 Tax=Micromonospora inaquosa TaxID=2203716 RepID=A0A3N9W5R6_9ACTN|nr:hypothetical protein DLJ59_31680 [Micromonospora inaquosa]